MQTHPIAPLIACSGPGCTAGAVEPNRLIFRTKERTFNTWLPATPELDERRHQPTRASIRIIKLKT